MIELPLDELLAIAEKDLRKNQAAFAETAKKIDPAHTPMQVLAKVQADHPPADEAARRSRRPSSTRSAAS